MLLTQREARQVPPVHARPTSAPSRAGDAQSPAARASSTVMPLGTAIACLVLVAVGLRPGIVSIGPILPDMIATFGLSHTEASLLTAIPTLLMGLLALPTPWLTRRFGRDRVIVTALVVLAGATAMRPFAGSALTLFAATAGVGAGIAVAGTLVPGFVKASFPSRTALLMGIYAMALSLGSTVSAAITGQLAELFGTWRVPAGLFALPAIVGAAAWLHVERRQRTDAPAARPVPSPLPVRNLTAWLVAAFFALNNFIFYSFVSWIAPVYIELGYAPASAGLILASFTVAFMTATPLFGAMSRHEDRRRWLALAAAVGLGGVLWMALAPAAAPHAAVSLIAFGCGGAFTLGMTLPLDNARTESETAAWNAFVMLVSYLVGATGPVITGTLRDATGDFQPSLWMLVVASVAMLATTPFLQPHHHRLAAADRRRRSRPSPQGEAA